MLLSLITIESLGLKHYLADRRSCGSGAGAGCARVHLRAFEQLPTGLPLCAACVAVGVAATLGCQKFNPGPAVKSETLSPAVQST
jgi:hypothetical protein